MEPSVKRRIFGNKFAIPEVPIYFPGYVLSGKSSWNTSTVGEKPGMFRQTLRPMNVWKFDFL